jgi:putative ABC transport system permease protein
VLLHDLQLAWLSFKRNPFLVAVMVGAIAAGIGATLVTLTLYHAQAANPIPGKAARLYAVTLDARSTEVAAVRSTRHPEYPPTQLSYPDAVALFASDVPQRKVMMYKVRGVLDSGRPGAKPFPVMTRLTTADFFPMFDVPFLYGSGWPKTADEGPEALVVLSKRANDKAFGGANSVGRMLDFRGHSYRVVGVLDDWLPKPKFYDVTDGAFDVPEDIFLPFRWGVTLKLRSAGARGGCMRAESKDFPDADCVIQFWAELANESQGAAFQRAMDAYVTDQKELGRFPRPLNNHLADVPTWLEMNDVVKPETRTMLVLALMFLAVCVLNTVGLMLAKFLGAARSACVRRALGATRADIMRQYLVEVLVVGIAGGTVGLLLSVVGLSGVRAAFFAADSENPESATVTQYLTHIDFPMFAAAIGLSLLAGLLAGLYPAWRICRVPPTLYLRAQ